MKRILLIVSLLLAPSFALANMQFHVGGTVSGIAVINYGGLRAGVKDGENLYSVSYGALKILGKPGRADIAGVTYRRYLPKTYVAQPVVEFGAFYGFDSKGKSVKGAPADGAMMFSTGFGMSWPMGSGVNFVPGVALSFMHNDDADGGWVTFPAVLLELSTEI